ncbi:AI-2E family transporter [Brooklawnia cerclae]|uniref:PurR-regulated permease PerM n=1 Tax=Brooklawnia cerclae TaxID=349934 RepID=A0ABX0SH19_9ACTN|nr:AI-2E family transporter [Brooklawnia cerclae]NIH57241.1 putative PurR-regulated permease PerM [Brooklawnia cerclae]
MAMDQAGAHPADASPARAGTRFNSIVIGVAGTLVALIAMRQFADLIGPLFLALNLMITAYPVHTWLVRKGTPSWLSAVAVALTVFAVLIAMVVGFIWAVNEMVGLLTDYGDEFNKLYEQVLALAAQFDFNTDAIGGLVGSIDPNSILGAASSLLSGASGLVAMLGVVIAALVFMAMDTPGMEARMRRLASNRASIAHAMGIFAAGVRRYWLVTTIFGIIVAILDGIALAIMGVPLAVVWALFSFLTNYIPNIGFVVGLVPPALVALFAKGWQAAVLVIVIYSVLNFVVQSIIQPRFTGESVGVTPTVSFISLLLWTGVIGGMGTLLALPLTLLVKALVIDVDPRTRWVNALIASDPADADEPHET